MLLDSCVNFLALFLIEFDAGLFYPRIHLGIRVVAAVSATRREALAVQDVLEYLWVLVGSSDPAQRIHLKRALHDVSIERGEFKSSYVEIDPDVKQLLLQDHGQQATRLFGRGLHDQMQALASLSRVTCLLQ